MLPGALAFRAMKIWQGAILTALLVLGLAVGAGANTMSYSDPAGDVAGGGGSDYDLVRTGHGHQGGFLAHTTRTRGPHTDDSPGPELYIRVGAGRTPDFRVSGAGVYRIGTGSGSRKVGVARLVVTGPKTLKLLFRARAINNPRKYEWRIYMGAAGGAIDRAPAGYVTHVLR